MSIWRHEKLWLWLFYANLHAHKFLLPVFDNRQKYFYGFTFFFNRTNFMIKNYIYILQRIYNVTESGKQSRNKRKILPLKFWKERGSFIMRSLMCLRRMKKREGEKSVKFTFKIKEKYLDITRWNFTRAVEFLLRKFTLQWSHRGPLRAA